MSIFSPFQLVWKYHFQMVEISMVGPISLWLAPRQGPFCDSQKILHDSIKLHKKQSRKLHCSINQSKWKGNPETTNNAIIYWSIYHLLKHVISSQQNPLCLPHWIDLKLDFLFKNKFQEKIVIQWHIWLEIMNSEHFVYPLSTWGLPRSMINGDKYWFPPTSVVDGIKVVPSQNLGPLQRLTTRLLLTIPDPLINIHGIDQHCALIEVSLPYRYGKYLFL